MGSPYLEKDETIVLTTHKVLVNSIASDMILTNRRILISDSAHEKYRPKSIPLARIASATGKEDSSGFPVLVIAVSTGDDPQTTTPSEIVFVQKAGEKRMQEHEEWNTVLKKLAAPSREEAIRTGNFPPIEEPAPELDFPEIKTDKEDTVTLSARYPKARGNKVNKKAVAAAIGIVALIAVLALAFVMFYHGGGLKVDFPSMPTATPTPAAIITQILPATTVTTTIPAPATTLTPAATAIAAATSAAAVEVTVPETGVWIKVKSTGYYAGTAGTAGRLREIAGTGVHLYQVPVSTGIVDISIQKTGNSGEVLTVEVYVDGKMSATQSTRTPKGSVDMHVSVHSLPAPEPVA
jgi:hypothetical protein